MATELKRLTGEEFDFAKYSLLGNGTIEVALILLREIPREDIIEFVNHATFCLQGQPHLFKCERGTIRIGANEIRFRVILRNFAEARLISQGVNPMPPEVIQRFASTNVQVATRDPRKDMAFAFIPPMSPCFCTNQKTGPS